MPELYRFLDSFETAVAHLEGNFRFSSFAHFREVEDERRRDILEGQASYQVEGAGFIQVANDSYPTQAIYILSMTECDVCVGFGDWRIDIRDKEGLRERIAAAVPNSARVFLEKVQYGKPAVLPAELSSSERLDRAWRTKPEGFSEEREWRYIVVFAPDLKITNRVIQLRLGDCSDLIAPPKWIEKASHVQHLEALKKPHEMHIPDVRSTNMARVNGVRQEHLFKWMREAELSGSAPKDVRDLYDVARNVFLYSWYQYRFSMVAAQVSIAAVEMALRSRFKMENIDIKDRHGKDKSLRPLLADAVTRGWLTDAGFGRWLPGAIGKEDRESNRYCETLKDVLPDLRNSFAHGTSTFLDQASMRSFLGRSAAIIDQLFPYARP